MATRIRLARGGKKHRPYYRIVVQDRRAARDGKFIERVGSYDPLLEENSVKVDTERITYWLSVGATPTHRVSRLLAAQGMEHKLIELPPENPVGLQKKKEREAAEAAAKAEAEKAAAAAEKAKADKAAAAEAAAAATAEAEAPAAEEKAGDAEPAS